MTGVLIKKGNLKTHDTQGEPHVKIKSETEVILPQQRLPANHQKPGKRIQFSATVLRRNQPH